MSERAERTATPAHIGIIMDGNGRWAQERDLPRYLGHQAGARAIPPIVEACASMGVGALTLYAFSTENWSRPKREVKALMTLMRRWTKLEAPKLAQQGVRLHILGQRDRLPKDLAELLAQAIYDTRHGQRMDLAFAINYGGREEIVDATREIVRRVRRQELLPHQLDENVVAKHLYAPQLGDLDLVIRTGGDLRLSGFMLWQAVDALFWSAPCYWPDFGPDDLYAAIKAWKEKANGDR